MAWGNDLTLAQVEIFLIFVKIHYLNTMVCKVVQNIVDSGIHSLSQHQSQNQSSIPSTIGPSFQPIFNTAPWHAQNHACIWGDFPGVSFAHWDAANLWLWRRQAWTMVERARMRGTCAWRQQESYGYDPQCLTHPVSHPSSEYPGFFSIFTISVAHHSAINMYTQKMAHLRIFQFQGKSVADIYLGPKLRDMVTTSPDSVCPQAIPL